VVRYICLLFKPCVAIQFIYIFLTCYRVEVRSIHQSFYESGDYFTFLYLSYSLKSRSRFDCISPYYCYSSIGSTDKHHLSIDFPISMISGRQLCLYKPLSLLLIYSNLNYQCYCSTSYLFY